MSSFNNPIFHEIRRAYAGTDYTVNWSTEHSFLTSWQDEGSITDAKLEEAERVLSRLAILHERS
jgi:hypothetical protein